MKATPTSGRCSLTKRIVRSTVVVSIMLLALWPATALSAETPSPFDLQAAINACPTGGTVTVPAGTFTITSTIVPKSNITIQGSGAQSVLFMADPHSGYPTIIKLINKTGVTIRDLTLASNDFGINSTVRAMELGGASNITIDGVAMHDLFNGIVVSDNGSTDNYGLTMTRCQTRDIYQPMFLRNTHDSVFGYLDLHAMEDRSQLKSNNPPHHIYIANDCTNLTFDNCTLSGGCDYSIQIYPGSNIDGVTFTNLALRDVLRGPVIWGEDGSVGNITFDGVTASSSRYYYPSTSSNQWFLVRAAHHVTIRNFNIEADGKSYLARFDSTTACTLENGIITGSVKLPSGLSVSGLAPTVRNVTINATVAPITTTSTTVAKATTTSTTVAKATTTSTTVAKATTTSTTVVKATTTTTTTVVKAATTTTQKPVRKYPVRRSYR